MLNLPLHNLKIYDQAKRSYKICEYLASSCNFRQLIKSQDLIDFASKLITVKKVKGALSQCERAPLTLRYATYCIAICHV